jgi:hypothetical protein
MIIKHLKAQAIFYPFIGENGKKLILNQQVTVPDSTAYEQAFKDNVTAGNLEVVSYDADAHDHVVQEELTGGSGGAGVGIDPANIVGTSSTNVQDVFEDVVTYPRQETATITGADTVSDLSYTPRDGSAVMGFLDGTYKVNGVDFSISGKAVTWNGPPSIDTPAYDGLLQFVYNSTD